MPFTSYPPAQVPRSEVIRLLVTPQEKQQIVALAERRGSSVAALVRSAIALTAAESEADHAA